MEIIKITDLIKKYGSSIAVDNIPEFCRIHVLYNRLKDYFKGFGRLWLLKEVVVYFRLFWKL